MIVKVKDLITKLSEYDPEMLVLIQWYEYWYDEFALEKDRVSKVKDEKHRSWLYKWDEQGNGSEALILMRGIDGDKR